uniref:Glyco_hydro_18 domain-containing protein n=1 Tax=Mesocestoides corti TaxID=53468 RepID=A0A5K3F0U2_MESCO
MWSGGEFSATKNSDNMAVKQYIDSYRLLLFSGHTIVSQLMDSAVTTDGKCTSLGDFIWYRRSSDLLQRQQPELHANNVCNVCENMTRHCHGGLVDVEIDSPSRPTGCVDTTRIATVDF